MNAPETPTRTAGLASGSSITRSDAARELVLAFPMLLVLALLLFWSDEQGGYAPVVWYPGALILLGLLALIATDRRFSLPLRGRRAVAVAALAAYGAWSALSILWAQSRGDAWDSANRTLLYVTVFAVLACWPMSARRVVLFASIYAVGVAAIGFATIERATLGSAQSILVSSRLALPTGYMNGTAALFLIPLWPALFLSCRRELPALARGLLLATAGMLLQLAVLAQSRGSAIAFPVVLAVFLILTPSRGRAMAAAAAMLAATAINLHALLQVYRDDSAGRSADHALAVARNGMALSFLALLVLGVALAALDRRLVLSGRTALRLERAMIGVALAGVLAAAGLGLGALGHPIARADHAWHNFSSSTPVNDEGSSHFTSLGGTNRYDFWRVSMQLVRRHALNGVGAGNFAVDYLRLRHSDEEPLYPHSLEMSVLLGTGIVGALLFAVFLGAALLAALRRRGDSFERGLAAACVTGFLYWLVHGSVDWFWELPALSVGALGLLALAVALREPARPDPARSVQRARRLALAAASPVVLAVAVSYALPWLSARSVELALQSWRTRPASAFAQLDHARALNPMSERPDLIAGAIAMRLEQPTRARAAFQHALRRNRSSWYADFELALLDAQAGRRQAALGRLQRASLLDPLEPQIADARRRLRAGLALRPKQIDRDFLRRVLWYQPKAH